VRVLILGCKDYPAFATPAVHSGGMEVYAERMVRSLADRVRFTLLTVGGHSDEAATVRPLGGARGLRTQPVSLLARSLVALRSRPDADVLNPQTPLAGLGAWWANRRFGIPYVVTVHIFAADPSHTGGDALARLYDRVERLVYSRAAAIVPTGRRLAAALAARHPSAASRIRVVTAAGGGVVETAPRAETRARFGISEALPCLLFLGRIVEENVLTELVTAFRRVRDGGLEAMLLIAGSGNREAEVEEKIRALGVQDAVRWLGPLRGAEKFDVLAAADVMVRTSRHEVFPEAYLEALSVGTPVAATPAGDTPDLADDSGAIALLPFGDPEGQARILAELLADRARLTSMRDRALDHSRRVTWERRKEDYFRVLADAAGGAR
jgi:glycosyltransferase involved in cell wall biosynthesis